MVTIGNSETAIYSFHLRNIIKTFYAYKSSALTRDVSICETDSIWIKRKGKSSEASHTRAQQLYRFLFEMSWFEEGNELFVAKKLLFHSRCELG